MKKLCLVMVLFAMSLVMAQADNGWGIFAAGWKPADGAYSYGPGLKFQAEMTPGLVLALRGTYFDNVSDESDIDLQVVPLEVGLDFVWHTSSFINMYFGAGGGYYLIDGSYNVPGHVVSNFDPEDSWGYYANTSIEYLFTQNVERLGATHASVFLEALYRGVEVDKASVNNRTYAIEKATLSGFGINAGLMLRW